MDTKRAPRAAAAAASAGESPLQTAIPWLLGLALTAGACGFYLTFGPFEVIRGTVPVPGEHTPTSYFCYVFFPFGLLVGDVWLRARRDVASAAGAAAVVGSLAALGLARLLALIPFSGHALLAAYYICHEAAGASRWGRRAAGLLLAGQIVYFKLQVFRDVGTLVTGGLLGLTVWSLSQTSRGVAS